MGAVINYYQIEKDLKTVLEADANLSNAKILIEPENVSAEQCPLVAIYLTDRESTDEQPISYGTMKRFTLRFDLWCYECNPDKIKAFIDRDKLMNNVEVALVSTNARNAIRALFRMTGGEFENGLTEEGKYMSGGSVKIELDQDAILDTSLID